jgi:4-methyl-5(b-hydroxyethyl)-thiazole monophosphate biosynthesis
MKKPTAQQPAAVLVPLAEGFEEIEAVTIVDVLRRAGLPVVVAGLAPGRCRGSHGIVLDTDCALADVDPATLRTIVLPGGMPGTQHLLEDERVLDLVRALHESRRPVSAICAAPMVLAAAGVLDGRAATSHPSVRDQLGLARVEDRRRVVKDGLVTTSQGPGTALEFALALVEDLVGPAKAESLSQAMLAEAR